MQNKQLKLIAAGVLIVLAAAILFWHFSKPKMPNAGQPVEVVCPKGHRFAKTWDFVYAQAAEGKALMEGGRWHVKCPECGELTTVYKAGEAPAKSSATP